MTPSLVSLLAATVDFFVSVSFQTDTSTYILTRTYTFTYTSSYTDR